MATSSKLGLSGGASGGPYEVISSSPPYVRERMTVKRLIDILLATWGTFIETKHEMAEFKFASLNHSVFDDLKHFLLDEIKADKEAAKAAAASAGGAQSGAQELLAELTQREQHLINVTGQMGVMYNARVNEALANEQQAIAAQRAGIPFPEYRSGELSWLRGTLADSEAARAAQAEQLQQAQAQIESLVEQRDAANDVNETMWEQVQELNKRCSEMSRELAAAKAAASKVEHYMSLLDGTVEQMAAGGLVVEAEALLSTLTPEGCKRVIKIIDCLPRTNKSGNHMGNNSGDNNSLGRIRTHAAPPCLDLTLAPDTPMNTFGDAHSPTATLQLWEELSLSSRSSSEDGSSDVEGGGSDDSDSNSGGDSGSGEEIRTSSPTPSLDVFLSADGAEGEEGMEGFEGVEGEGVVLAMGGAAAVVNPGSNIGNSNTTTSSSEAGWFSWAGFSSWWGDSSSSGDNSTSSDDNLTTLVMLPYLAA